MRINLKTLVMFFEKEKEKKKVYFVAYRFQLDAHKIFDIVAIVISL